MKVSVQNTFFMNIFLVLGLSALLQTSNQQPMKELEKDDKMKEHGIEADYPSDTHDGHDGAVIAFSQLISTDESRQTNSYLSNGSRHIDVFDDEAYIEKEFIQTEDDIIKTKKDKDEESSCVKNDDGIGCKNKSSLKLHEEMSSDVENEEGDVDTQYLLEEFYGYTYDEAVYDGNESSNYTVNTNDFDDDDDDGKES